MRSGSEFKEDKGGVCMEEGVKAAGMCLLMNNS